MRIIKKLVLVVIVGFCLSRLSYAVSLEKILHFPLKIGVLPIKNESEVVIYPNKYEVRDVLGEKATKMLLRFFRRFNRFKIYALAPLKEDEDLYEKHEDMDFIIEGSILSCVRRKGTTLGTSRRVLLELELRLYDIKGERVVFDRTIIGHGHQFLIYLEDEERKTWKQVEHSALGGALRNAILKGAKLVARYLPLRGRIIAVLDKNRFLINIGEEDGLRKNDTLYLIRAMKIRTEDYKKPIVLLPERIADLQVESLKAHEAIVKVVRVRNQKAEPPKEGDIVERPLYP